MVSRLVQANLKARDDVAAGRFWAGALGWTARSPVEGATSVAPAGFVWSDPDAPVVLDVIRVPDPSVVTYRVHVELAGAAPSVFADPEGNPFCVRETDGSTGPIAAVVVDGADPASLARFWSEVLGWTVHESTAGRARLRAASGTGPFLEFVREPHLPAGRHRFHLDVVPVGGVGQAAEVARLRELGATPADVGQGADVSWVVLADPDGNEFCVLAPS